MLVLSRRQQDSVVFPKLNIRVNVLRIDGKSVRLGIEAPDDVRVMRHEIADQTFGLAKPGNLATPRPSSATLAMPGPESSIPTTHALRNRFNVLTLRLHLLRRQLETDAVQDADASIAAALNGLAELEQDVAKLRPTWPLRPQAPAPRALLVEDNPNESELLAGYLRSCNFEVATASNGADALAYLARNEHPDVVLLDMNMPRMDGCATVRELRRNPATAGLKIVAVTGRTREEVGLDRCHQAFNRWFTKPIRPDVLVRELQSELGIVTSA